MYMPPIITRKKQEMAMRLVFSINGLLFLFFCIIVAVSGGAPPLKFFNVVKYGAVADGKTDNTQAFLLAWRNACGYRGRSRVLVPAGIFVLDSVSFEGSCNGPIAFLIKGTLRAPVGGRNLFTDTWIAFRYIGNLTVKGGGVLDGQGHSAWPYNDCNKNSNCKPLPVSLRFDFVRDSRVQNIRSMNSKSAHLNVFACENMNISSIMLIAPAKSPNTDGIKIGASKNIKISHSVISTGDDCVSMVSGSEHIDIDDVTCGPGHGISIGSLGRGHEFEYVNGISVRNCTFIGSDNGVRIKTWARSSYSVASNILFEDIVMQNSKNPIVIDQKYCPVPHCYIQDSRSSVQIKDVTFKNIRGVSSSEIAVNLQCSGSVPCRGVKLIDINLAYNGRGGRAVSVCSHVIGSSYGQLYPPGCDL